MIEQLFPGVAASFRQHAHDTTPSALESAREKVRTKAMHYERSRSGGADVFSTTKSLTPDEIDYKLRFIFGIQLTKPELKALVNDFDLDGDGMIDNAEFQVAFFKLAREGKERFRKKMKKRQETLELLDDRRQMALKEHLIRQQQFQLCEYTEKDVVSIQSKVAHIAKLYDVELEEALGPALKVFEGQMNPTQFREQLRRSLGIKMSNPEFSAFFEHCDRDQSGTIEGSEFKFEFLQLRRKGKLQAKRDLQESNHRITSRMKSLEKSCLERFNRELGFEVSFDFTEEDQTRALNLIGRKAAHFDARDYRNQTCIKAFQAQLTPLGFADQLIRSFDIRLKPRELGALISYVDRDGNGFIEGSEFWIAFQKEGRRWRELERSRELKQRKYRAKKIEGFVQEQMKLSRKRAVLKELSTRSEDEDGSSLRVNPSYECRCDDGLQTRPKQAPELHQTIDPVVAQLVENTIETLEVNRAGASIDRLLAASLNR